MSLGSSDMAGSALGTAFSLLLLASIIQGHQDVQVIHDEKMEAVEGQNVTLRCAVKSRADLQVVSFEWSKDRKENIKLALYSPKFGLNLFWPNVSVQTENDSMGLNLHLSGVTKWDSGIYICDLTTFPFGSIRIETELNIKDADVEIKCDVEGAVEVHAGENVTIQCRAFPNAQYRWTKNEKLVSENESLKLSWVTDAQAGVYALTVNTGNKSLHKDFIITVLTATTSLRTDLETVSPQPNVTEESADSGPTTSPTTRLSTIDTDVTRTESTATDVTDDKMIYPSNVTAAEHIITYTNSTYISVTSAPAMHTDPYHHNSSEDQESTTHTLNTSTFSNQTAARNPSTTFSYDNTTFTSTQETRNESVPHPEVKSSTGPDDSSSLRNITENHTATPSLSTGTEKMDEDTDGVHSHLFLLLIIIPMLLLITVAGFICRKQIIKQRMDLPPPFKPPPPPIKYAAARYSEISTQSFPISRCDSVT